MDSFCERYVWLFDQWHDHRLPRRRSEVRFTEPVKFLSFVISSPQLSRALLIVPNGAESLQGAFLMDLRRALSLCSAMRLQTTHRLREVFLRRKVQLHFVVYLTQPIYATTIFCQTKNPSELFPSRSRSTPFFQPDGSGSATFSGRKARTNRTGSSTVGLSRAQIGLTSNSVKALIPSELILLIIYL